MLIREKIACSKVKKVFIVVKVAFIEITPLISPERTFNRVCAISTFGERTKTECARTERTKNKSVSLGRMLLLILISDLVCLRQSRLMRILSKVTPR